MEELEVPVDGAVLAVSRTPGDGIDVVAVHGSVPGTRDCALYRHLHEVLPTLGIGIVTFDRRGEGASTGAPSVGDFEQQARDCLALLESLGPSRAGLWGFSQGGWVAPLVATRRKAAFVVTVGASGVPPHDQMRYGVARHLRDGGFDDHVVERVDRLWVDALRALEGATPLDEVGERLQEASREPWWPLAYLPAELPDASSRAALLAQMVHDPLPSFRAVSCPVLAIYGEHDEWVPVAPSVDAWHATQGANATTVVLPRGRHDPLDSGPAVAAAYERCLLEWLRPLVSARAG